MNRSNNLNFLSFTAALMVIMGHMCHLIGLPPIHFMGQAVSTIAVKVFFVISGFLTATSYFHDSNKVHYYLKRFFRIIPGYMVVIIVTACIFGPLVSSLSLNDYFRDPLFANYFKNILFNTQYALPGVFETNPYPNAVNGSLWTLPIQVSMYIILPIIFLLFSKNNRVKLSLILAISLEVINIYILRFCPGFRFVIWGTEISSALSIIPYFFLGIVFTSEWLKARLNLQLASIMALVLCMISLTAVKTEILIFLILPYFIFSFAFIEEPFFKKCFMNNDVSYGIYLYSFVIQQTVVYFLNDLDLTLNQLFILASLISIAFGYLSWFLIEKPFQILGKKLIEWYDSNID